MASSTPAPSPMRSCKAAETLAVGERVVAAGELQQEQDEAQELTRGTDAAGQDTVEPIVWIADEAGQDDG